MSKARLTIGMLGVLWAAAPAVGQDAGKSEASVQFFGSFVTSNTVNGVLQTATNSGGELANYRFLFSASTGVEVDYGHTINTQLYELQTGQVGVKSSQHEVSAAFVYRRPLPGMTLWIQAGGGGLIFDSTGFPAAAMQTRLSFVYGLGTDFSLGKHFFLRLEQRGMLYSSPTFGLTVLQGVSRVTNRIEPSAGLGYRF
jgi:opacity protein-like surface antigen